MKTYNFIATFLLLLTLFLSSEVYSQKIQIDTIKVEEVVKRSPDKLELAENEELLQSLKKMPNTNVIGELSGHPFELVINGVSGFRHNYSIWGIPINFESTSSTDMSLLGEGRYSSVDIDYDNVYMARAIGSNVNLTPKIDGESTILLKAKSNYNFTGLGSYLFPKYHRDFDLRVTFDVNSYKNYYSYVDDNGTLYNTTDDKTVEFEDGWSENFHVTFTERVGSLRMMQDLNIVERSVIMQNGNTKDPVEQVFSINTLANYGKTLGDNMLYAQNFQLKHSTVNVIDTNLAVTYNMGYTTHNVTKASKLSLPFSFEYFFDASALSLNVFPSYDVSQTTELFLHKNINNTKRARLNEKLIYSHEFDMVDVSASVTNSNRYDVSTGVYRVYNTQEVEYKDKEYELDYSADANVHLGISTIAVFASSATRFPSLYELYGDNLFVIPNPDLKSEESVIKTAIAYGLDLDFLMVKLEYQFNRIENLITSNMVGDYSMTFVNTDAADINTLSLFANYSYKKQANVTFNIAYNNAINKSKGSGDYKIPNIHPLTSKLLLNYNYKRFGIELNSFYYSYVYTNVINKTYTKPAGDNLSDTGSYGYLPEHVKIDIGLSHLNNYFKAIFGVENLLNNRVSLSPNHINQGRLYSLTLMKKF